MNTKFTAIAAAWLLIAPTLLHAQPVLPLDGKATSVQANTTNRPACAKYRAYGYARLQTSYPTTSYRYDYPLDAGYRPEAIREMHHRDSVAAANITTDMMKDGLITSDTVLSFTLSSKEFIVNGVKQSDTTFQRYKQKYAPAINNGDWQWTHTGNKP